MTAQEASESSSVVSGVRLLLTGTPPSSLLPPPFQRLFPAFFDTRSPPTQVSTPSSPPTRHVGCSLWLALVGPWCPLYLPALPLLKTSSLSPSLSLVRCSGQLHILSLLDEVGISVLPPFILLYLQCFFSLSPILSLPPRPPFYGWGQLRPGKWGGTHTGQGERQGEG